MKNVFVVAAASLLFIIPLSRGTNLKANLKNISKDIFSFLSFTKWIRIFPKVLATNFPIKVAQIFAHFGGYFETHIFLSKNCCGYFLATFGKIGQLVIPTSRYTDLWSLNKIGHWF